MNQSASPDLGRDSGQTPDRRELALRLDDLRGFGLLPAGDDPELQSDEGLVGLCLKLIDALEITQRRVIETSIQILSLRELVAKLLSLRTPEDVAETVTLYLLKAFDHQRVLVGVFDPASETLDGWAATRDGDTERRRFQLNGSWGGSLRDLLENNQSIHAGADHASFFLTGSDLPAELVAFLPDALGPHLAFPLSGRGQKDNKVVGVLMVGQSTEGTGVGEMDEGIIESVADAVGTAMENVILEEDVRREEAFRKDIMGSMASGLIAVDLEGRVLTMNVVAESLTGFSLADLRGSTLTELDPAGGGLAQLLTKTLRTRKAILGVERAVCRPDRSAFPATCATTLLRNPQGDAYGAVVTFTDLSEIKRMEERIRSLDRLAALGRFTAGIAHEIRNPLTGISTGVQYLERQLKDQEGGENLQFIQREIQRLDRIVEDLFRVTHPHPLRKTPENAREMVDRAIQALGSLPEETGVRIQEHFDEDMPPVPVDPDQIQQVLLNLIKNAVEATPEGGEVIIRGCASLDSTRPQMVYQVIDSGSGIDGEATAHVFEPFFTKGKPNGTGLGLYVSHGIVERHGGELHAANHTNSGAIFTLMLPLNTYD